MRGGVSVLLDAWERALPERPVGRALALLAASSGVAASELAELSLGERDRLLFALRERLFGTRLSSLATCPRCAETVELICEIGDLTLARGGRDLVEETESDAQPMQLDAHDHEVLYRRLTSADLLALRPGEDLAAARGRLLDRCILTASRTGEPVGAAELPDEVKDAVAAALATDDPQADVQLDLTCAACGAQWQAAFDIAAYLWSEVEAWAHRTLLEIHTLAARYGWSESAILSMSAWRRQVYLGFEDA
jgi:hypothetical protein